MTDPDPRTRAALVMKEAIETKSDVYGLHPETEKRMLDAMNALEKHAGEMKPRMTPIQSGTKDCEWTQVCEDYFDTACGKFFEFSDGGVADNGFEFCPFCGGHINLLNEADS